MPGATVPSISALVCTDGRTPEMLLFLVISAGLPKDTSNNPSFYVFSASSSGVLSILAFPPFGKVYKINSIFGLNEYSYKL